MRPDQVLYTTEREFPPKAQPEALILTCYAISFQLCTEEKRAAGFEDARPRPEITTSLPVPNPLPPAHPFKETP